MLSMPSQSSQWVVTLLSSGLGLVLIAGIVLSLYFRKSAQIKRWLQSDTVQTISELSGARSARLVGHVAATATRSAPLTARPAVFFDLVVEEDIGTGGDTDWVERLHLTHRGDFTLTDRSGTISVSAQAVAPYPPFDIEGDVRALTPELQAALTQLSPDLHVSASRPLRLRAISIGPGDRIAVVGHVSVTAPDSHTGSRFVAEGLTRVKSPASP